MLSVFELNDAPALAAAERGYCGRLTMRSPLSGAMPAGAWPRARFCGARSLAAATALAEAGYERLYNVEEGFEGDKDAENHRGHVNGWRFHGLPWEQT